MKVIREELVNMREEVTMKYSVITEKVTREAAAREGPSRREAVGREGHLEGGQHAQTRPVPRPVACPHPPIPPPRPPRLHLATQHGR